jgi:protein gp37
LQPGARLTSAMRATPAPTSFSGWTNHVYNPWLSATRLLRSTVATVTEVDGFAEVSRREQVIEWNRAACGAKGRVRVFAGPWCRALTDDVDRATRSGFWELVRATPAIDWLLIFDGGTERSVKLPPDWGEGFSNCWIGVKLAGPGKASGQLDALRSIPARHRFAVAAPLLEDLGDLTLHGLHWFIAQVSEESDVDSESVVSLKLQCMAFGMPFWFEEPLSIGESKSGWGRFCFRESPAPRQV